MNSQILGLKVAGVVFGLFCLAQLLRLTLRTEVLVAGNELPLGPSGLAVAILAGLSLWMWKLSRATIQ